MWTKAYYLLVCYILMGTVAPISLIGNGFILAVIITNPTLRKESGLYLLGALSFADFFLALFVLPYVVYLNHGWSTNITYDAQTTIILNLPVVFQMKVTSVLTVAVAFDRFSALYWPASYRNRRKDVYAAGAMAIGIIWSVTDCIFYYATASFLPKAECGAAGCFMSDSFRYYWGVSDMFVNAFAMVITLLVLFKIRTIGRPGAILPFVATRNTSNANNDLERAKFKNASHTAAAVLLCSGVCIFIPSVMGGLGEMTGLQAFSSIGPFVAVGLISNGVGNAVIFGVKHTMIRQAIRAITRKNNSQTET